ncbi:histone deacetylase HDT1-like isoform X2 [Vicia villosa]|uniref:histone deacetylase HDT1-like isoform X2 n=1 Tax=Vicia villosa TaxID=3911 RepID=UPI00273C79D7|nr:histone deacetylase HDT1-like isoform X2 [Vicia villosa]
MEFWGVEVKSGKSLKVVPEESRIIHLSSACLGEVSKDKGNEPVSLYVKFDDKKVQLGTLSSEKFPQTSYDLVFEKDFELSHNWKYGSVFFTGYKFASENVSDDEDEDSDGKPEFEVKSGAKSLVNGAKPKKTSDEDESSESDSDSDDDSGEEKPTTNGHIGISEDDDDSDEDDDDSDEDDDSDDSDEETLAKAEGSSKRNHESSKKTPVPVKKAKFVGTPEKTGGHSGGVHVDTPYPKQALKSAANNKQQTPKSNGDYSCKPCNRSFKTEDALGSHNKAKHSAK